MNGSAAANSNLPKLITAGREGDYDSFMPEMLPPSIAPLIALTTDFGRDSPYVGAMKGVIFGLAPMARVVDFTHGVAPQNIAEGAWVLDDGVDAFPDDTIHVVVVDPGVGTSRRLVYARLGTQQFLAPDNGVLSRLARRWPVSTIRLLAEPRWWRPQVSNTFHGRDILAPVAARLSLGLEPVLLGPPLKRLVELDWPEVIVVPGMIQGAVRTVDSFGNLVTDIPADKLRDAPQDDSVRIECDEHETQGIFRTYGEQPPMTLLALIGSSGFLEIAIVGDSAAMMLGVQPGAKVTVRW